MSTGIAIGAYAVGLLVAFWLGYWRGRADEYQSVREFDPEREGGPSA